MKNFRPKSRPVWFLFAADGYPYSFKARTWIHASWLRQGRPPAWPFALAVRNILPRHLMLREPIIRDQVSARWALDAAGKSNRERVLVRHKNYEIEFVAIGKITRPGRW